MGTSLVVITTNCAAGFAEYAGRVAVPWAVVGAFTAVAILGIVAGTRLVQHVSAIALRRAFAAFLVLVGALVLWQNRAALRSRRSWTPRTTSWRTTARRTTRWIGRGSSLKTHIPVRSLLLLSLQSSHRTTHVEP